MIPENFQQALQLVDQMRERGVKEFSTGSLHVVFFSPEEAAPAADHQTPNDDPKPGARPRRYPGGRLVSVPSSDDE